jgi:hypothetical protein
MKENEELTAMRRIQEDNPVVFGGMAVKKNKLKSGSSKTANNYPKTRLTLQ